MLNLSALSVSDHILPLLSQDSVFIVHSLFTSSLNLESGGRLIHIGSTRKASVPFGIDASSGDISAILRASQDEPSVVYTAQTGEFRWSCGTTLSISDSDRYSCAMRQGDFDTTLINKAVSQLSAPMKELAGQNKFGLDVANIELNALAALLFNKPSDSNAILDFWVGRGEGLTPSGDDILMGILAVLFRTGRLDGIIPVKEYLDTNGTKRTTAISCEYLRYALEGIFSGEIIRLMDALGHSSDFSEEFSQLLAIGHTSGADTLLGISSALGYLVEENQ